MFVVLFKTGYGSEGYPIGIFQTEELAKQTIHEHETRRSPSYNESGVLYEIYVCNADVYGRELVYTESRRVVNNLWNSALKQYENGCETNVDYLSKKI
jgi:hypothetical protein